MKKLAILLLFLIIFLFSSCEKADTITDINNSTNLSVGDVGYKGTSAEGASLFDEALQKYENTFVSSLDIVIPFDSVTVSCETDVFNISVIVTDIETISDFGKYIVASVNVFEEMFSSEQRGELCVILYDGNMPYISFFTNDVGDDKAGEYGLILDERSSVKKSIPLSDVSELCKLFPTTKVYINSSSIEPNDLKIYNETMDALNSQPDRSEDEILSELAPNYNMTADELKTFMHKIMGELYK